jgi:hypothetical protein
MTLRELLEKLEGVPGSHDLPVVFPGECGQVEVTEASVGEIEEENPRRGKGHCNHERDRHYHVFSIEGGYVSVTPTPFGRCLELGCICEEYQERKVMGVVLG